MFEIINTATEEEIEDEYVAIGCYIDENKIPYHSVLIIRFSNQTFQYHYPGFAGVGILMKKNIEKNCFHKITKTIDKKIIPAFIVMCKRIMKTSNPKYGYFYSGEYYDNNGQHFSNKAIGETMTCAGFCVNILKGFLESDYLFYEDWSQTSYPTDDYLDKFALRHGLVKDDIAISHRRISPLELLCSGFFSQLPIRKTQIDSKTENTQEYLKNYKKRPPTEIQ